MKKKKRGLTIKIKLTNRWLYTFIALGILAVIGVGVYASTWANSAGVGHDDFTEIKPCSSNGQILQWTTTSGWVCASASDSDWIISGNNMYSGVSGNVGIGTTSPREKLDVRGNAFFISSGNNPYIMVGDTPDILGGFGTIQWRSATKSFEISASGGRPMALNPSTGNVGIGTTNPGYKLDVVGDIRGTNNLYVSGNVGIETTNPREKLDVGGNIVIGSGGFKAPIYLFNKYCSTLMERFLTTSPDCKTISCGSSGGPSPTYYYYKCDGSCKSSTTLPQTCNNEFTGIFLGRSISL